MSGRGPVPIDRTDHHVARRITELGNGASRSHVETAPAGAGPGARASRCTSVLSRIRATWRVDASTLSHQCGTARHPSRRCRPRRTSGHRMPARTPDAPTAGLSTALRKLRVGSPMAVDQIAALRPVDDARATRPVACAGPVASVTHRCRADGRASDTWQSAPHDSDLASKVRATVPPRYPPDTARPVRRRRSDSAATNAGPSPRKARRAVSARG